MDFRPVARNLNLVIQRMENETIVYDLTTNHALYLNETSAIIWNLCDGRTSIGQIRDKLKEKFGTSVSSDFVWFAIYKLRKDKLLSSENEIDKQLKKFSGRRAIKRFGFDSTIAMPMISSVIAPTAASCLTVPPTLGAQKTV